MSFRIVEKWQPVSAWGKSMESYLAQQGIELKVEIDIPSPAVQYIPRPKKEKVAKIKPESEIRRCSCGNEMRADNKTGKCWPCQQIRVVRTKCSKEGCKRRMYTSNKYGFCSDHSQVMRKRARVELKKVA